MKTVLNFLKYSIGKSNTQEFYSSMRRDYIFSKHNIIDKVCKLNGWLNPKYKIQQSQGILGNLDNSKVNSICQQIKNEGYYIFPNLLPASMVEQIKEFASRTPINYLVLDQAGIAYSKETVKYAEAKNVSNRFQILNISQFKDSPESLKIATDSNLLHIANNYFGAKPILDLVIFWWSRSLSILNINQETKEHLKNRSAQMYHIDLDRLKFLKFFVYLTDVNSSNGPHVYVKKTHNKIPNYINKDGRYTDDLIEQHDKKSIVEITGKAGSIMAVDTRGLHKGKELEEGERLIFQIEFTNSMFGKPEIPNIIEKFDYHGNDKFYNTYKYFFKKVNHVK